MPGTELKLVPNQGKHEVRVRGPQVTLGYFRGPGALARRTRRRGLLPHWRYPALADPAVPNRGLIFDGRVSEAFKLTSGTGMHVRALRLGLIAALAPLVQDVVIAGHDREAIGMLLFLDVVAYTRMIGVMGRCDPALSGASPAPRGAGESRHSPLPTSAAT